MKNTLKVLYEAAPIHAHLTSYEETLQALRTIINPESYCQQNVYVLLLNADDGLLGWRHLARGTADAVLIDVRMLVTLAAATNAASIVLAHTHLHHSNGASVSVQDFMVNYQPLGRLLNTPLKDYILLTAAEAFSLAEDELFPTPAAGYNLVAA